MIGGHSLEAADGDRLAVQASATAGRLTRTIARASQDTREHVRLAVEHVGVREAALGDQPDVFGHVGVRRASPLTVDNFVEVIRIAGISW